MGGKWYWFAHCEYNSDYGLKISNDEGIENRMF